MLNYSRLASDLGVPRTTVAEYVAILETVYLIRLLPAWSTNVTTRAVAMPKAIFVDGGFAAYLTKGMPADTRAGGLVESFALGEIARRGDRPGG